MGYKYVRRPRMESLPALPDETLVSIGAQNIIYEKYDEQIFYYDLNRRLDIVQARISAMN